MKEIHTAAKSLTLDECVFFYIQAQEGCYCFCDRSSNAVVECDDGEFKGIGGYQGQREPDPVRRQSEAQRLPP